MHRALAQPARRRGGQGIITAGIILAAAAILEPGQQWQTTLFTTFDR